jgi:hypothetical protein
MVRVFAVLNCRIEDPDLLNVGILQTFISASKINADYTQSDTSSAARVKFLTDHVTGKNKSELFDRPSHISKYFKFYCFFTKHKDE